MQGSNADVVPFLDGYAFRFHVFQYLLRLHLLIEAVFRYNHGRASVASLGFCVATLFYRILPSDALFFYIKKAAAFLQPPLHIFLFLFKYHNPGNNDETAHFQPALQWPPSISFWSEWCRMKSRTISGNFSSLAQSNIQKVLFLIIHPNPNFYVFHKRHTELNYTKYRSYPAGLYASINAQG